MKAIVCEMCNSNQMRKENGYFVCQNCGTQYSVEEAKKLMVEIEGSVKINREDDISNLYIAARNARDASDYSTAVETYEMLTRLDPNNWEPIFYSILLKAYNIKNGEITNAASRISSGLPRVYELVKNINDPQRQKEVVKEVADQSYLTAKYLIAASHNFRNAVTGGVVGTVALGMTGVVSSTKQFNDDRQRGGIISSIVLVNAELIEKHFDINDPHYHRLCLLCYQMLIKFHEDYKKSDKIAGIGLFNAKTLESIQQKIKQLTFDSETRGLTSDNKEQILKLQRRNAEMNNEISAINRLLVFTIVISVVSVILVFFGLGLNGGMKSVLIIIGVMGLIVAFSVFQNYRKNKDKINQYTRIIYENNKEITKLKNEK